MIADIRKSLRAIRADLLKVRAWLGLSGPCRTGRFIRITHEVPYASLAVITGCTYFHIAYPAPRLKVNDNRKIA